MAAPLEEKRVKITAYPKSAVVRREKWKLMLNYADKSFREETIHSWMGELVA